MVIEPGQQLMQASSIANQGLPRINGCPPSYDLGCRTKKSAGYSHESTEMTRSSLPNEVAYRMSPTQHEEWVLVLLRREIPMAWGTTTDSLTPEINPFQYAIEIKNLTLKDQTSYLIRDGWSRSPLKFPTSAWIDESLPQQQVNNTSILYIMMLDLF